MKNKKAFSIIELVVGLVVIALIASTTAPIFLKKMNTTKLSSLNKLLNGANCHILTDVPDRKCTLCYKKDVDAIPKCLVCTRDCALEQYQNKQECACHNCAAEYDTTNPDGSKCIRCNYNFCTRCNRGYYLNSAQSICNPCEAGHYCLGDTLNPLCPAGQYNLTTKRWDCDPCPKGKYCTGGTNNTCCPKGTYRNSTLGKKAADCFTCADGWISGSCAQTCTYCNAGTYENGYHTACNICEANFYCTGGRNKQPCPPNSTSPAGSTSIAACKCNAGYYRSGNDCKLCEAGFYCPDGLNRHQCGCGYYSAQGAASCFSAQAGWYTPIADGLYKSAAQCPVGTYSTGGANCSCSACPYDTYATGAAGCSSLGCACASCRTALNGLSCVTCAGPSGQCTSCDAGKSLYNGQCYRQPNANDCAIRGKLFYNNVCFSPRNELPGSAYATSVYASGGAKNQGGVQDTSCVGKCCWVSQVPSFGGDVNTSISAIDKPGDANISNRCTPGNDAAGLYTGCSRPVCTAQVAWDYCLAQVGAGSTYPLPTVDELRGLFAYSRAGFNFCAASKGGVAHTSVYCPASPAGRCLGAAGNVCHPEKIFALSCVNSLCSAVGVYQSGLNYYAYTYSSGNFVNAVNYAASVRCATRWVFDI